MNEIGTGQTTLEGTLINSADDVLHFAAYADKSNKYQHWYEVNFVGESKTFKSKPVDVEATLRDPLVINLDETGVLSLDIKKGDVDFDQIRTAEVVLSYADPAVNVANVGGRFFLDAENPTAQFQKVIFAPKNNPWTYQVKYTMADDGREILGPEQTEWGPTLYVNDLFSASRLVLISALGDLKGKIDRIVVDLQYVHPEYDYRVSRQATLRDGTSDEEWRFPVVSETAGALTFSGQIFYRDGTVETIDEQVPKGNQILVGDVIEEKLKIEVVPDFLFDDPSVRLVSVDLTYTDPKDGSQQTASPKFRPPAAGSPAPASFIWVVDLRDDKARDYSWQAKFFLEGGAVKSIPPTPSSDSTIVPQLSDATA